MAQDSSRRAETSLFTLIPPRTMKHCGNCWVTGINDDNVITPLTEPFCMNDGCSCHQEKEIDKEDLLGAMVRDFTAVGYMSKSEARRRFEEIRAADRAALVRAVEGMKKDVKALYPNVGLKPTEEAAMAVEGKNRYNQALDDVLALLHSPEKK